MPDNNAKNNSKINQYRRWLLKTSALGAVAGSSLSGSTRTVLGESSSPTDLQIENNNLFVQLNAEDFESRRIVSQSGHRNGPDVTGVIETRPRTPNQNPEFNTIIEVKSNSNQYTIIREYTLDNTQIEIIANIRLNPNVNFFMIDLSYTNIGNSAVTFDHESSNIHDGVHIVEKAHLQGRSDSDAEYQFSLAGGGSRQFSNTYKWETFQGTNWSTLFDDTDAATFGLLKGATSPKMWIQENDALDYLMNEVTVNPDQTVSYQLVIGIHEGGNDAPVVGEEIYNTAKNRGYGFTTDSLYVWGTAADIVLNEAEQNQFFAVINEIESTDVFFSWDSLYGRYPEEGGQIDIPVDRPEKLESFLESCDNRGINIHGLIGSSNQEELNRAESRINKLSEWQQDRYKFSGLHLNLEAGEGDNLHRLLNDIKSRILDDINADIFDKTSITIAPWWGETHQRRENLSKIRDHNKVDFNVIIAYEDNAQEARTEIKKAMRNPCRVPDLNPTCSEYSSKNYMWAFELQDPANVDGLTDKNTFYHEGSSAVDQAITSIASSPPISESQYQGTTAHFYSALPHYKS